MVFAGFIFLVLLSQVSAHVLAEAILSYYPHGTADLAQVRSVSLILAISAGVLGVAFGTAVLLITRKKLMAEIDVYRATGLPFSSALGLMVNYHPTRPLSWLACAAAVAIAGDLLLGLNFLVPLDLAVGFASLLVGWLVFLTVYMFGKRGFKEGHAKVG